MSEEAGVIRKRHGGIGRGERDCAGEEGAWRVSLGLMMKLVFLAPWVGGGNDLGHVWYLDCACYWSTPSGLLQVRGEILSRTSPHASRIQSPSQHVFLRAVYEVSGMDDSIYPTTILSWRK